MAAPEIKVLAPFIRQTAEVRCRSLLMLLLSGLLVSQLGLLLLLPGGVAPMTGILFLLVAGGWFFYALGQWLQVRQAFRGLNFTGCLLQGPPSFKPRPLRQSADYQPLPEWLIANAMEAAPHVLTLAVDDALARDPELRHTHDECLAARGQLTNYDAVNLLLMGWGLERGRANIVSLRRPDM